jgi:hypothetical protein
MVNEEELHQKALIVWFGTRYPKLTLLLWHTPNGGKRNLREAVKLKTLGVRAGVPDLFLAVPRGTHHGLFIEMKSHAGRLSVKQQHYLGLLYDQGYATAVCYKWTDAAKVIEEYLENDTYS